MSVELAEQKTETRPPLPPLPPDNRRRGGPDRSGPNGRGPSDTIGGLLHLWALRHLIAQFVERDFAGRYKGSLLGRLWPLINPLGHMILYTFLFGIILKVRFSSNASPSDFALYLMSGFLPWAAMSESLASSTTKILEFPNLVKRVVFPLEILPLVQAISSFTSGFIAVGLLIVVAAVMQQHVPYATVMYVPLIMIPHFLFTAGLSWLLASLGVFVRDMRHFISLGLSAWMYATPILYPVDRMPENLQFLLWINPMAGIINDYRRVILQNQAPDFAWYGLYSAIAVVVFLVGFSFFKKTQTSFADVM